MTGEYEAHRIILTARRMDANCLSRVLSWSPETLRFGGIFSSIGPSYAWIFVNNPNHCILTGYTLWAKLD
jgi:hypothetical protein